MDSKVLNEHLKGVADAIRSKEGSSELISPMDFAQRIEALQVGEGGGADGGIRISWRYFDVSQAIESFDARMMFPSIVRIGNVFAPMQEGLNWDVVVAVGVDGNMLMVGYDGSKLTWNEMMALEGMTPEVLAQMNIIEITEEEFLNKTFE